MANTVYYNPTLGLQSITPALDDETFLFFLESYYDWMQTTDIIFNGSSGPFTKGELITGEDSRATATIRYVGSNTITVSMQTDIPFDLGEEIVGSSSANSAFVLELSDNVLRKASRIRENKNNEKAQGQFLEYLKGELNKGIPVKTSADRRRLIAQLKEFFRSKSTEEAYTFLFRALFNETIEIRYPGDDLLRVSDGNFLKQSTIRINEQSVVQRSGEANVISGNNLVVGSNTDFLELSTNDYFKIGTQQAVVANVINATHMLATTNFSTTANNQFVYELVPTDIFSLKNKTIKGQTSGAIGVVADVRASTLGGKPYADVILRLISGGFLENEIIEDIDKPSSNVIVYGVVSGVTINDGGTGYAVDDELIISGDGSEATAKVTSVSEAPITKIVLANTGIGYQNNLNAVVNNSGTGGTGFAVRISEIANTYTVGANNQFTVGDTVTLRIVNRGSGYVALPTITLQDTSVASLGLLHDKLIRINNAGTLYEVGDALVFTNPAGFTGNTAVGRVAAVTERWAETPVILVSTEIVEPYKNESLLDDFGSNTISVENAGDEEVGILIEGSYYDRLKTEDWRGVGPIERLELTYSANGNYAFGSGYSTTSLPTIAVTSANGVGANLQAFNIQGKSAVVNIDASNNIAGIGSIREVTILDQGLDYTTATIDASAKGDGNANIIAEISGLFVDSGRFTNDDGKVNFKILQDSLFYQDFSYVIRSGLSFDRYKDIVKEVVHPAGLEFFGEIVITSTISLAANFESAIAADRAPRFASLFSFLSLFEGIGLPPPVTSSIIVRIKPVVSYTDQAKLDTHREMNLEIAPTVINAGASAESRFKPILTPFLDVGVFGGANVTVIPVSPSGSEYDVILAGASVPATFDSSGAVREVDLERFITTSASVIESTDPGLKGPIQYALGPLSLVSQLQSLKTIEIPLNVDVSTSFFDAIITMETGVKTLEIDVVSYVEVAATIIPSDQIATPKFFKTELDLAPNTQVEYKVDIESVFKRMVPFTFGELSILEYENAIIVDYADTSFDYTLYNVGPTHNHYKIQIPSYVDTTMAFYSNIVTMETDIKSVEIDIELFQSIASTANVNYKVDIQSEPRSPIADFLISELGEEPLSLYSGSTFYTNNRISYTIRTHQTVEIDLPTVNLDQTIGVVASDQFQDIRYIQPKLSIPATETSQLKVNLETFADLTMAFYSDIVTVETDIKSVEIDIELFKTISVSMNSIHKIEQILELSITPTPETIIKRDIFLNNEIYNVLSISRLANEYISNHNDSTFTSNLALTSIDFVNGLKTFLYQDEKISSLADKSISEFAGETFKSVYTDNTVMKNVPIAGTVDVALVTFEDLRLNRVAGDAINNYATNTFTDSAGQRPYVIGSNTSFLDNYLVNDNIIIGNEKFIVKAVSNNTYLEINVSASQNYNDVSAYREYFV